MALARRQGCAHHRRGAPQRSCDGARARRGRCSRRHQHPTLGRRSTAGFVRTSRRRADARSSASLTSRTKRPSQECSERSTRISAGLTSSSTTPRTRAHTLHRDHAGAVASGDGDHPGRCVSLRAGGRPAHAEERLGPHRQHRRRRHSPSEFQRSRAYLHGEGRRRGLHACACERVCEVQHHGELCRAGRHRRRAFENGG